MSFDADAFMSQTVDAPLETEYKLVPAGEYRAMIGDFTSEAIEQFEFEYKSGSRAGQPGTMTKFTCPFVLDAPQVAQELGRDQVIVNKQITLDLTDTGGIATGVNKNVELGRVRKAVGQENMQGWTLPSLRNSGPCMVKVEHRRGKRKDGSDFEIAEVTRVAPITS